MQFKLSKVSKSKLQERKGLCSLTRLTIIKINIIKKVLEKYLQHHPFSERKCCKESRSL